MKFGVMINSNNIDYWQLKCIAELIKNNQNTLKLCIINSTDKNNAKKKGDIAFKIYHKLFISIKANTKVNIEKSGLISDSMKCKVEKNGIGEYFNITDIKKIKAYNLDFILRFGYGIIRGEILESTRYGIWSFHHGDEMHYRGRPAGFWEIYEKNPQTGVILQKLTEKLDAGIILKKGIYKTFLSSYSKNINQILLDSSLWPSQVCKQLKYNENYIDNIVCSSTKSKIYRYPNFIEIMIFIIRSTYKKITSGINILFYEDVWNVALIQEDIKNIIKNKKITNNQQWLKINGKKIFIADPFISDVKKDKVILFVEEYKYSKRKGLIKKITCDFQGNIIENEIFLECSTHLSYPFLVTHKNINYCMPESDNTNRVELYTCDDVPLKKTLLLNEGVIDSTLFYHDNLWWCFGTKKSKGSNLKLYCWYSENIQGKWNEHKNNPIKHDITSSRPAGSIIKIGKELYRPSQNCAEAYGNSITINKIIKLNPYEFIEKKVFSIKPKTNGSYPDGLHTINSHHKGIITIDGKIKEFRLKKLIYKS